MNNIRKNKFFSKLKTFKTSIFGELHWQRPLWASELRQQAATHRLPMLVVFSIFILGGLGYAWYSHLPKPKLSSAMIVAPKISEIGEDALIPDQLTINFGLNDNKEFSPQSVAPLSQINKVVTEGITMKPQLKGKWTWINDHQLVFSPDEDWPADQTFHLTFQPQLFAKNTNLASYRYTFTTLPFTAKITEFKLYQDPIEANHREAVATVSFNYPVDPTRFEKNVTLTMQALNAKQAKGLTYPFSVTYDKFKRHAVLHSEHLNLPENSEYLILTLNTGITSATGSASLKEAVTNDMLIPDKTHYFTVAGVKAAIVRNAQDRPEQVLVVETSLGAAEASIKQNLQVKLLPKDYPANGALPLQKDYEWKNPGEINANILAQAKTVDLQAVPAEHNYASLHSFIFNVETPRYLYVKLKKGMKGFGDFTLSQDYEAVVKVPEYPKEIGFLHKGALLALSGEQKLSVLVRGCDAVKFNFARVLPENVNQLVTQTQGDFNNPLFINKQFNEQNISEIFSEVQTFDNSDLSKQNYTALDFAQYLKHAQAGTQTPQGPLGLFLLQANAWDADNNKVLDTKASRLILLTDMGLVVKDNQEGSHDVFVQSITQGKPLSNVLVSVLGKNGLPILTQTTDEQGHVSFPALSSYTDEREPVVYLATLGQDVSFIPYANSNRQLNFSKFDIGGVYTNAQETNRLSAYLFSDRGIYRPGDTAHIGMIVKQAFVTPPPPGLILEASVTDPRGITLKHQKLTLDALGYLSMDIETNPASPTGTYALNLYLVKDNQPENFLGSTTIRVAEFQPDRMRIKTQLSAETTNGWISPEGLKASVTLMNLYGAPATDRRITGRIVLEPKPINFDAYPDYSFADPLRDPKKPLKTFTDTLPEQITNAEGKAQFPLNLDRFEKATLLLTFFAEGFEAEGGRSVATQTTALVSPLPYLIGYKADGDLNYIRQNAERKIHYLAVNPQLQTIPLSDLQMQITAMIPVSTLVKKANGTYQYQSIVQTKVISTTPFSLSASGTDVTLPTNQLGDFGITILDKTNSPLSSARFTVVGASQRSLAQNAELTVKLDKDSYHAGDEIELQITAPYTGAGLITIERDKVFATQWFKTDTTSSVQHIRIPNDFQGNGYVNVTFVRNWNSPDIFMSPLSYSVTPFEVDTAARDINIDLDIPKLARPGEPFTINYHSDKPGKIIVFAVDEGILQVARYEAPEPLAFFFQKHALEVITQQTVDQILPQYLKARELSAAGGDGGESSVSSHLNPFKRKTDLPVVYWSGIVDTDLTSRQLSYQIPDYFNGTLHVMAVAVAMDAVGSAEKTAEVRGDFVINPNLPTFATPGDEFELTASIANNVKSSGNAAIAVELGTTAGLQIIGSPKTTVQIAEGQENTVRFKVRATEMLGNASCTLTAHLGKAESQFVSTLSIRPANPQLTTVSSGMSREKSASLTPDRTLYPEYRVVEAGLSSSPLILVSGLQRYLDNFPYGCTEQLTSKIFPLLAMTQQPWLSSDFVAINKTFRLILEAIVQRQMSNGGFSYWPGMGDNAGNDFASVYTIHFLTDARAAGFDIPTEVLSNGLGYLKTLAEQTPTSMDSARIQAYAIYMLTRNEIVTTNLLTHLQRYLDQNQAKLWQKDITGAYLAATYQMLKSSDMANQLINQFDPEQSLPESTLFYDKSVMDAQYLYILSLHFPQKLAELGDKLVMSLVNAINSGEINTILSSYTSIALNAYAQAKPTTINAQLSISEILSNHEEKTLAALVNPYANVDVDSQAREVRFNNPDKQAMFYQLTQSGFDKNLPSKAKQKGIEVYREYHDKQGNVITQTTLGQEIEVHIQVRALNDRTLSNIALVDLLPAGFEVVRDSVSLNGLDYVDVREDRVVFIASVESAAKTIVYRIKATNMGQYVIPPIMADSMYDPGIYAHGIAGKMTVVGDKS